MSNGIVNTGKRVLGINDFVQTDTPAAVVLGTEYTIMSLRVPRTLAYAIGGATPGTRFVYFDPVLLGAGASTGTLRIYRVSPDGRHEQKFIFEETSDRLSASPADITKMVDIGKEFASIIDEDELLVLKWTPKAVTDTLDISACTLRLDVNEIIKK